jgi:hypothetical protein
MRENNRMNKINNNLLIPGMVAFTVLLSMISLTSANDDIFGPGYNDKINIRLSAFRAITSTGIQVASEQGVIGEELSFEDDLDLSE